MTIGVQINTAVAAPTYAELITLVAQYLNRADLNDNIPAFIELATRRFNRILFTEDREASLSFNLTGRSYELFTNDIYRIKALFSTNNDDYPLEQITFDQFKRQCEYVPEVVYGDTYPRKFAFSGSTFYITPDCEDENFTLLYDAVIPILSDSDQVNWVLDKHPDAYLYGALVQAEAFLENDARVSLWKSALDETLGEITGADQRRKFGGGPLVMRAY